MPGPRPSSWAALLLALATASCSAPERPSVLLVTIDTLRPDRLGAYGHPDARTPHLDALARRGLLFEDARVPYALTLPSHATLLTGLSPYAHGARRNDSYDYDTAAPTLASVLAASGYATGAIVSTFVLNRNFGLAESFGSYDDLEGQHSGGALERRADEVSDRSIAWLKERADSTFLLWAHYFDPHDDYEPPAPWDRLYADVLYDGEIAYTDRELGRLLRHTAERDDPLVIVTSDHGESLGEHQEVGHGYFLYDTTLRIPLVLSGPGWPAGEIHADFVRSLDVFPTVCDRLGLRAPEGLPGRSLLADGEEGPLYLETFEPSISYGATELKGVVRDDWKYILAPRPELYDLAEDPHEVRNLFEEEPETAADLAALLDVYLAEDAALGKNASNTEEIDEDARRSLEALGYLGGGQADAGTGWSRRDPKDIVHLIPIMYEGILHCRQGRWEEGIPLLEKVLEEDPINGKALFWVSKHRAEQGDADGALDVFRDAVARDPGNANLLNRLGLMLIQNGEWEEAVTALRSATNVDPQMVSAHLNLARALMMGQQPRRARASIERALKVDPTNPVARQAAQAMGIHVEPEPSGS